MLKMLLKCPENFVSHNFLKQKIDKSTRIRSYGLKSGHIETDLYENDYDIELTCNRYFVWEFWRCLINSPSDLLSAITFFHKNVGVFEMENYRDSWYRKFQDPYERAAFFYLLNRYSETGSLGCPNMSKHNFSVLNLRSFEQYASRAQNLQLSFCKSENVFDSIESFEDEKTILLPIGNVKRDYILKKNVKTVHSMNFNLREFREYLPLTDKKVLAIFKYNDYVNGFFNEKTLISRFGTVTENPELAEDLIVSNF